MILSPRPRSAGAVAGFCTAALLLLSAPVAAQEKLVGEPILEIVVDGTTALQDETLLYYLGLEEGQAFDPQALNRGIYGLWAGGGPAGGA